MAFITLREDTFLKRKYHLYEKNRIRVIIVLCMLQANHNNIIQAFHETPVVTILANHETPCIHISYNFFWPVLIELVVCRLELNGRKIYRVIVETRVIVLYSKIFLATKPDEYSTWESLMKRWNRVADTRRIFRWVVLSFPHPPILL